MRAVYTETESMCVYTEQKTGVTIYIYSSSRKFIYVYTETKLVYVYTEQKTGVTIYIYIVAPRNLTSAAHIEGRG